MKISTSFIIILILNLLITGNVKASFDKKDDEYIKAIAKVLPDEFENYKKQINGDNGLNDAKVSLSLVSTAQDLILKSTDNTDPNQQEEYNKAYYATWRFCTAIMKKTKDQEVKKLILERWNNSIKKDDISVPYQIYAIAYDGWDPNRSLLSEDFWKLLEQTKRKKAITAISFVLYQYGNREDAEILMKKQNSGIDIELQVITQRAITWMDCRLSGYKSMPPTGRPSRLDFKVTSEHTNIKKGPKAIAGMGIRGLPYAMEMFKDGDYRLSQTVRLLLRKKFESSELPPDYKDNKEEYAKLILKWWSHGKRDSEVKFVRLYEDYNELKKSEDEEKASKLLSIKNLGIAVLPHLIEKIRSGDTDLIQVVVQLTTRRQLPKDATQDQVIAWWEKNKENLLIPFPNKRPTSRAGQDRIATSGQVVQLDGSASTDPDNEVLTYKWKQISGPVIKLSDSQTAKPSFIVPEFDKETDLVFELVVNDGSSIKEYHPSCQSGQSEPDNITIKIKPKE